VNKGVYQIRHFAMVSERTVMQSSTPKPAHMPRHKPERRKLSSNVERDEGPSNSVKTGYRNSDEVDTGRDARHDDPVGV
jgi:hypothetical protein